MGKIDSSTLSRHILISAVSLTNMLGEMYRKGLELKRMTKAAALLSMMGYLPPAVFSAIKNRCVETQYPDGGWVAVVDAMWNLAFLQRFNPSGCAENIRNGYAYLESNTSGEIWGRSKRDFARIPVTGTMLYLHTNLASGARLQALERLWLSERNSLTYKAAYTLMAFSRNSYEPESKDIIKETVSWLASNQRPDGSFAPWKDHPVASDTYCTAIALLGLLSYPELVQEDVSVSAAQWLLDTQLKSGVWPCHEIDDGSAWAAYALFCFRQHQAASL